MLDVGDVDGVVDAVEVADAVLLGDEVPVTVGVLVDGGVASTYDAPCAWRCGIQGKQDGRWAAGHHSKERAVQRELAERRLTWGGSATPRYTEPVGAVAMTVLTCVTVSYEYTFVVVLAYRTNDVVTGFTVPVME